ncbi:MAG: DUF2723 domain-containing protein [Gemmatimonadetes bacterium]|jgi:hypothetical protein|nr:DUF2723 domain-containing protein [Gemmatimonadota bacterium]MBT6146929.1 DUF2723 domain-containing protein [Gemmatimonadota bacterium]MBT7862982.1 DUF2723 domain-containing protein [Gemmatimonadota bacterium]
MLSPLTLHRAVGAGVFLVTLVLYTKTMAPTVSFWDTGEFISCSYILGVPHPPGSPLYVLLGRVFSLIPIGEVASRVVFMSVLSSALAVLFTYNSALTLARRALGGEALRSFGDSRDWAAALGAAVAALCLATSYTFWFNGTEAEVYAYSLFFVCGGLWLIFYWEGTQHGAGNDRWLFFIAYFFGLGGGLHLLCLLTIPALVILAWFGDKNLRRLILVMAGAGLQGLIVLTAFAESPPTARLIALLAAAAAAAFYTYIWSSHSHYRQTLHYLVGAGIAAIVARGIFGPGTSMKVAVAIAALAVMYHLFKVDRRALGLLVGTGVVFVLGYSTYIALWIRSGLDPAIDMNNPENLFNFLAFVNREQYGTDSQLLGMLTERASRTYQLWDQQMKYFFQQWPFPFLERAHVFRWATEDAPHVISISLVPIVAGLGGMIWHGKRDWRRFLAVLAVFGIMGLGLSLYLNMPDPQPRERHYVFGGMFLAWALWMGLGWTALVDALRSRFALSTNMVAAVSLVGLLLPAGVGAKLYHEMDRTGDFIAHDYAYNLLQSCDPNSLLFTNGDNDTFPLWYMQEVEGVRRDVRIVNLSLLNTSWYIKQLRDREPKVAMSRPGQPDLTDDYIDSTLVDTQLVDLYKRVWREPRTPYEFTQMGFDTEVNSQDGHDLLRVQDVMSIGIVYWNDWKRPIHYAITVASGNRIGLDPYLEMQGMTMKLMKEKVTGAGSIEALSHNLFEVYKFRSINDPDVYKDVNTSRLLGNYRACVMTLAEAYKNENRLDELARLLRWAEETVDLGWQGMYTASEHYREAGRSDLAVEFLHRAGLELVEEYGKHPSATYENGLALGSILLNTHRAIAEAEEVYRRTVALEPGRYDGVHELAATLQAGNRSEDALTAINEYIANYGAIADASQDKQVLENSIAKRAAAATAAGAVTPGDVDAVETAANDSGDSDTGEN